MTMCSGTCPAPRSGQSPGSISPLPSFGLVPQDGRLAEVGWDRSPMPAIIQTFGDGLRVGEIFRRG